MFKETKVRVIMKDNKPWWVNNDVCRVLDIANTSQAFSRLDDDEKSGVYITDPHNRPQKTNVINESGLYSLILTSRKPEAKEFKRWITHEVLPSIRQTGTYVMGVKAAQDERKLTLENDELEAKVAQMRVDVTKNRLKLMTTTLGLLEQHIPLDDRARIAHEAEVTNIRRMMLESIRPALGGPLALTTTSTGSTGQEITFEQVAQEASLPLTKTQISAKRFEIGKKVAAEYRERHGGTDPPKHWGWASNGKKCSINTYYEDSRDIILGVLRDTFGLVEPMDVN